MAPFLKRGKEHEINTLFIVEKRAGAISGHAAPRKELMLMVPLIRRAIKPKIAFICKRIMTFVHGRLQLTMQLAGQILHSLTSKLKSYVSRPKEW